MIFKSARSREGGGGVCIACMCMFACGAIVEGEREWEGKEEEMGDGGVGETCGGE